MKDDKKNFRFYWEDPVEKSSPKSSGGTEMHIEIPGFKKDEITANITGNFITITATKKRHDVQKGKDFYSEKSSSSSFSRSVSLPSEINPSDFELVITDGVVSIKKKKKIRK